MTRGAFRNPSPPDPLVGSALGNNYDAGCANQDVAVGAASTLSLFTGFVNLTYFRVPRAFLAAKMAYYCTVAAAATPTLVKFGLYSVAANGDLTRIGITASDTTIFSVATTRYERALLAAVGLVPGQTYASAMLEVTGAAAGSALGAVGTAATSPALSQAPRRCAVVGAQTDIPASIAVGSLVNFNAQYLAEILA